MEITKRYCDMCGKEITNSTYRHLVMPIYTTDTPKYKRYLKNAEIDVCEDCGIILADFIEQYEKTNEEEINE